MLIVPHGWTLVSMICLCFVQSTTFDGLDINGAPARLQSLPMPLHFFHVSKNESVTISQSALVTMQWQASAGPLLRNVPSLIFSDDSTESLVGQQLLLDLTFDPQQLLEDARVESNGRDSSHVPSAMIHERGGLLLASCYSEMPLGLFCLSR
jgi:hypothetical protein